jgi:hypothetical protein
MATTKTYESKITYQRENGLRISSPVERDGTAVEFLMAVANIMEAAGYATESICESMRTVATLIEE